MDNALPPAAADPTRRALIAAVAGGLALAGPVAAQPRQGKKRGTKTPPAQAVVVARLLEAVTRIEDTGEPVFDVTVDLTGFNLRTDPPLQLGVVLVFPVGVNGAGQLREKIVRQLQGTVAATFGGLDVDRVQILLA